MTEEERAEAVALLESPDILDEVRGDLDRLGFVGEGEAVDLLYLVATSRRTSKPLAVTLRSGSGTGKTSLLEAIASLMPPEEIEEVSRLTAKSLYYMDPGSLRHKLLVVDGQAGAKGATDSLRTLHAQGRLSLLAPLHDPSTRGLRTTRREVEGPVAYLEALPDDGPDEGATRSFVVSLDGSAEQTERVQEAQCRVYDPETRVGEEDRRAIRTRHRNAQRLLEPLRVAIPFADRISYPTSRPRHRWEHERFLSLVGSVAFLHQRSRPRVTAPDGSPYVEALPADYRRAYELTVTAHRGEPEGPAGLPDEARELHGVFRSLVAREAESQGAPAGEVSVTRRQVEEATGWSSWRVRKGLEELVSRELVEAEGRKGSTYHYWLDDGAGSEDTVLDLTPPAEIEEVTS